MSTSKSTGFIPKVLHLLLARLRSWKAWKNKEF